MPQPTLTTQMKSVGEVMAIGRTFQESFQKAMRGLETGLDGWALPRGWKRLSHEKLIYNMRVPNPERMLAIKQVGRRWAAALLRIPLRGRGQHAAPAVCDLASLRLQRPSVGV